MHPAAVKKVFICVAIAALIVTVACGPAGPALGLGPALDPFIGIVLLLAVLLGGSWVLKSVAHSPGGQAIEKRVCEKARSWGDWLFSEEHGDSASRARDIIKGRYARGELDRDHYLQMLQDLDEQR